LAGSLVKANIGRCRVSYRSAKWKSSNFCHSRRTNSDQLDRNSSWKVFAVFLLAVARFGC